MQVSFTNNSDSIKAQEEAFLKLEPIERIYAFLHLMYQLKDFYVPQDFKSCGAKGKTSQIYTNIELCKPVSALSFHINLS